MCEVNFFTNVNLSHPENFMWIFPVNGSHVCIYSGWRQHKGGLSGRLSGGFVLLKGCRDGRWHWRLCVALLRAQCGRSPSQVDQRGWSAPVTHRKSLHLQFLACASKWVLNELWVFFALCSHCFSMFPLMKKRNTLVENIWLFFLLFAVALRYSQRQSTRHLHEEYLFSILVSVQLYSQVSCGSYQPLSHFSNALWLHQGYSLSIIRPSWGL